MTFKNWLKLSEIASAVHGGIYDFPSQFTNDNMPVRSKYVTNDGYRTERRGKKIDVDKIWKFKKKKKSTKTDYNDFVIDKHRKSVPIRVTVPFL